MRDFDFQAPQYALLIIFIALIIGMQLFIYFYRQKQLNLFADHHLIPYLLKGKSQSLIYTKIFCWGFIWILLCLALMSPEGNVHYLASPSKKTIQNKHTHEIIFLIDTSASMGVADGENEKTRLEEAKAIIQNLITQLQDSSLAIYAFTSTLTPLVPQTLDYLFVRLSTRSIQLNEGDVGGTQFLSILQELVNKISIDSLAETQTIVLLSDGGDNQVYANETASTPALSAILDSVSPDKNLNLKFFTVGIGQQKPSVIPHVTTQNNKKVTSQLQPLVLKKLAEQTKGLYYEAATYNNWELSVKIATDIKNFLTQNRSAILRNREVIEVLQSEKISDLYYQIPLGISILLLMGGLLVFEN